MNNFVASIKKVEEFLLLSKCLKYYLGCFV